MMGWNYISFRGKDILLEDAEVVRSALLISSHLNTDALPKHLEGFREYMGRGILASGVGCYTMLLDSFLRSDDDIRVVRNAVQSAIRSISALGERVPGSLFHREWSSFTFFDSPSQLIVKPLNELDTMLSTTATEC